MIVGQQLEYVIKGKPMPRIQGIETTPLYKAAYRVYVNAGKNRTKATAREYDKLAHLGANNPMQTKIIMNTAKRDYKNDVVSLSNGDITQYLSRYINIFKTNFELKFNSNYRKSQKVINDAMKEQYPTTYKQRNKLLAREKLSLENNTSPYTRLGRLNINPLNL